MLKRQIFIAMIILICVAIIFWVFVLFSYDGEWSSFVNGQTYAIMTTVIIVILSFAVLLLLKEIYRKKELFRRQSEEHNTILNDMNGAAYQWNAETRELIVTDAVTNILGYSLSPQWYVDIPKNAHKHPEFNYKQLLDIKNHVELTGEKAKLELCVETEQKGLIWIRITMSPLYNQNKQLINIYGVILDVTAERAEHQKMVMDREHLAAAVFSAIPLIISVNLTKNTYSMLNYNNFTTKAAAADGVFDDLIAIGASTILEPDRQKFIEVFSRDKLLEAFASGQTKIELEYRQIGDDGICRWILTMVVRVNNPYDDDVFEITLSRDITVKKEYEAALQKTYDLTLENMPCYVGKWLFTNNDVLLIEANQKYLDFMEITAEEAYNKSIIYGFSEKEKRVIIDMLYEHAQRKESISFISRACKSSGEECWLRVQASFFEEKDGCSVCYGTLTEITELIEGQKKLTETVSNLEEANARLSISDRFLEFLDASPDSGILVRSIRGGKPSVIHYLSGGILRMCGYSKDEFLTHAKNSYKQIIHPGDLERVLETNKTHMNVGDSFIIDFRIRHSEGHYVWLSERSFIANMPDGETVVVGIICDISVQKQLEQKLHISHQEYQIAAALSDYTVLKYDIHTKSISVLSPGKNILQFSKATEDVPEAAILQGYVPRGSIDVIRELFAAIDKGEKREKTELVLFNHEGVTCWAEMGYSVSTDDTGVPVSAIITFEDISERKHITELFNISNTFVNLSVGASRLLVVNLTNHIIEYENAGTTGHIADGAHTKDSFQALTYAIITTVIPLDTESCAIFFDRDRLLREYEAGVFEGSYEYRGMSEDGTVRWNHVQLHMEKDFYTDDVKAYFVFSDIHEQKIAELELLRKAKMDSLTGLLNRESFIEEARQRYMESADEGAYHAIVMIDVDKFKHVNDNLGHDAGDKVLIEIAKRIKGSLREGDIAARYSGDEFLLLLPKMPSVKAIEQRCISLRNNISFEVAEGISVSGSIGYAIVPDDGYDFDVLVKKADAAMYHAKLSGSNLFSHYASGMENHNCHIDVSDKVERPNRIFARTFGFFDLFVDGKPIHFSNAKEKELLAILIDRNGGTLSSEEAVSMLWGNEPCGETQLARYRKVAMHLKNTLQTFGIDGILSSTRGVRYINVSKIDCDYYRFLEGDMEFRKLFNGLYMSNYSWAEETTASLTRLSSLHGQDNNSKVKEY